VNPRPSRLIENRYNFPSKLMEYLAAGRPIISTATSDVADHYGDRLVVLADETPAGLARCIEDTIALPEQQRAALGARSRAAVEGVTWRSVAAEIVGFIETLRHGPPPDHVRTGSTGGSVSQLQAPPAAAPGERA
jgi:glycosyltransferase involved in cell wall biosynthesis